MSDSNDTNNNKNIYNNNIHIKHNINMLILQILLENNYITAQQLEFINTHYIHSNIDNATNKHSLLYFLLQHKIIDMQTITEVLKIVNKLIHTYLYE